MINFSFSKYIPTLLSIILIVMAACSPRQHDNSDYDELIYNPTYSSGFNITGNKNSSNSLITIYNPWQGAKDISSRFLVVRDSIIPENFDSQILIKKPSRIVCMSSTHIAMLDALGVIDRIVGVSGLQYISNPIIQKNSDKIADIGYEGNIDYEKLISLNPDLVLLFSVNGASGMEPKLKELNIPFLYIGDYLEEDPLGKTEWIIPIAELLGIRQKGIDIFNNISITYNNLKDSVESLKSQKPKVMLNSPFADSWFMPSTESYVAKMMRDAGAEYVYKKNTGNSSLPIDMEEALALMTQADFWLNIGQIKSVDELKNNFPKFSSATCVKNGNLFNNNNITTPGGGNDCYESGVIHPELILRDLVKIFHPDLFEHDLIYYRHLE